MSDQINALKLNEKEEKSFAKFADPITFEYMDIPVILNGNHYDLSTVINAYYRQNKKDPLTTYSFNPMQVGPVAKSLNDELDDAIDKLKANRAEQEDALSAVLEENATRPAPGK